MQVKGFCNNKAHRKYKGCVQRKKKREPLINGLDPGDSFVSNFKFLSFYFEKIVRVEWDVGGIIELL